MQGAEPSTGRTWCRRCERAPCRRQVGVMVLVYRGSITQLVLGTVFSLAYLLLQVRVPPRGGAVRTVPDLCLSSIALLLLQMQAAPLVDTGDDYLANACS